MSHICASLFTGAEQRATMNNVRFCVFIFSYQQCAFLCFHSAHDKIYQVCFL